MSDSKHPGKVIGLKVEHTKPEEALDKLSMQLVEALTGEANWRNDAATYAEEANNFKAKASDLLEVLKKIDERDKIRAMGQEYKTTSRMDPVLTYNRADVEKEYRRAAEQAEEFRDSSAKFTNLAVDAKKLSDSLQKKIKKIQSDLRK